MAKTMYPDWKILPEHIMYEVVQRLELPLDYLQFSLVCKYWHFVVKINRHQLAKKLSSVVCPPMLLIPTEDKEDTYNLFDVMANKVLDLEVSVPSDYKYFCGCSKGWLIAMDENFVVTLINPFLRVKGEAARENSIIRLPTFAPPTTYWRNLYRATISTDPITNADDCIIVVTYCTNMAEVGRLAFLRLKKDTTWTFVDRKGSMGKGSIVKLFEEVVYVQDKFYGVNFWGKLLSFEITSKFNSEIKLVEDGVERDRVFLYTRMYLVYSNKKELLIVHRLIEYQDDCDLRKTKKFRVFGFDINKLKWTEKSNLDGVAIFLGQNSSIAVLASKFPGCKPNCIYFNHDNEDSMRSFPEVQPHDFGVYNFETQRFKLPYNSRAKNQIKRSKKWPIWISPTFQL